jgi:hypothetical protein
MRKKTLKKFCVGVWRFIKIVSGVGSENSHEIANNYVLLLGFVIEYLIIREAVMAKFPNSALLTVGSYLLTIVLVPLFLHQFMIFRNFALPQKIEKHREQKKLTELRKHCEDLANPEANIAPTSIGTAEQIIHVQESEPNSPPRSGVWLRILQWPWRRRKKALEIAIYFLFAVLTGEAGYMLTLLRANNTEGHSSAITQIVERKFTDYEFFSAVTDLVKTEPERPTNLIQEPERRANRNVGPSKFVIEDRRQWGLALEGLFLFTATVICVLVLVWDSIVLLTPSERKHYARLICLFILLDVLSFVIWGCVLVIITPLWPRLDLFAWLVLCLFYIVYVIATCVRFLRGFRELGSPLSYEDSRFVKI